MSKGNRLRNSRGARTAAQLPGARKGQGRVGTEPLTQKSAGFPSKVGDPVRGGGQAGDPVREGPGPGSLAGGSRVLVAHGDRPRGPLVDAGGTALPSATSTLPGPPGPQAGGARVPSGGQGSGAGARGPFGGLPCVGSSQGPAGLPMAQGLPRSRGDTPCPLQRAGRSFLRVPTCVGGTDAGSVRVSS